jgi:hypothetical protein
MLHNKQPKENRKVDKSMDNLKLTVSAKGMRVNMVSSQKILHLFK